jgi:hypothetical protein
LEHTISLTLENTMRTLLIFLTLCATAQAQHAVHRRPATPMTITTVESGTNYRHHNSRTRRTTVTIPEPLPQQFLLINPYYTEAVWEEKIAESRKVARRINSLISGDARTAFLKGFEGLSPENRVWLRKAILSHSARREVLIILLEQAQTADSLMGDEKYP